MRDAPSSSLPLDDHIWQRLLTQATSAGLDGTKFDQQHRQIVQEVVHFLALPSVAPPILDTPSTSLRKRWMRRGRKDTAVSDPPSPISPIIICGQPGTGKTTFLYLLDYVLRQQFTLPDNIAPHMSKGEQTYAVHKRAYNCQPVSLLSVKKWTQLLHFYAWDVEQHALQERDLAHFVQEKLLPMRVLFADEVEMTGYSPTIPTLAKYGILVVGTSNQYAFKQLDSHALSPHIYRFTGEDMRLGDPTEAIVTITSPLWGLFEAVAETSMRQYEQLSFRVQKRGDGLFLLLALDTAVSAPMLETDWITFWQTIFVQEMQTTFNSESSLTLLLDNFSLDFLRADFNAVIRFVSLFDAIEQLGLGVLVRHTEKPVDLSGEGITFLKTTIYNALGVPDEIKQKTAVGLDRCVSRIGQAGHKAHINMEQR